MHPRGTLQVRIALMLAVILPFLAVGPQAQAQPKNTTYWAAIAYSTSTGKYGYSYGWLSEVNASRAALKNCKADDAKVVLLAGNYYVALAKGDQPSAYGFGYAETAAGAEATALRECRKRTTNCHVAFCVHSWAG